MRVLIVDDSAVMREQLVRMFAELPEEIELVGQARDAVEATESIRKLKPDTVILDIRMPGGSGIRVLRTLKKETPEISVVMLTSYPYPQYRKECLAAGADFFLDKSTEFDKLPEILRQLMWKSPAR